jgi:hypothetical protein
MYKHIVWRQFTDTLYDHYIIDINKYNHFNYKNLSSTRPLDNFTHFIVERNARMHLSCELCNSHNNMIIYIIKMIIQGSKKQYHLLYCTTCFTNSYKLDDTITYMSINNPYNMIHSINDNDQKKDIPQN